MRKKRLTPIAGKSKTVSFNVRVEREALAQLRVLAQAEHRTVTNLVQLYIYKGLKEQQVNV